MTADAVKVDRVRFHRNGCGGEGFHVVTFASGGECRGRRMVGIVFDGPGRVAVIDLDAPDDLWRGDRFERDLRAAVDRANETGEAFAAVTA